MKVPPPYVNLNANWQVIGFPDQITAGQKVTFQVNTAPMGFGLWPFKFFLGIFGPDGNEMNGSIDWTFNGQLPTEGGGGQQYNPLSAYSVSLINVVIPNVGLGYFVDHEWVTSSLLWGSQKPLDFYANDSSLPPIAAGGPGVGLYIGVDGVELEQPFLGGVYSVNYCNFIGTAACPQCAGQQS
jgi:hypothetical protein